MSTILVVDMTQTEQPESPDSPAQHIQKLEANNRELRRQLVIACVDKDDAMMTVAHVAHQRNDLLKNNIALVDANRDLQEKYDKLNAEYKRYRDTMLERISILEIVEHD